MKKIMLSVLATTIATSASAGSMGPESTVAASSWIPFTNVEASYTWNSITGATLFGSSPTQSNQGWGGRAAVGFIHPIKDMWSLTSEVAWGYYGKTTTSSQGGVAKANSSVTNTSQLYGADLLVGVMYSMMQYDMYFKVGALAENRYLNGTLTTNSLSSFGQRDSSFKDIDNRTNVLPEIKVGGIYNYTANAGISVSYMHVFGSNGPSSVRQAALSGNDLTVYTRSNLAGPSLDAVLFGLNYKFA